MLASGRPSWSLAWATWTSRWVSTPMVSWGATGCGMLVMAVSFPWPGGGWHARRPGGQHCEESGRQAHIRSRPSGWRAGGGRGPGRQVNFKAPSRWTAGSDPDHDHHAVDRGGPGSGRQVQNRASSRRNQGSGPRRNHQRDHRSGQRSPPSRPDQASIGPGSSEHARRVQDNHRARRLHGARCPDPPCQVTVWGPIPGIPCPATAWARHPRPPSQVIARDPTAPGTDPPPHPPAPDPTATVPTRPRPDDPRQPGYQPAS
jgi:hypothetical protein